MAAGDGILDARLAVGFVIIETRVQQLVGAGAARHVERAGGNVNIGGDGLRALQADVLCLVNEWGASCVHAKVQNQKRSE